MSSLGSASDLTVSFSSSTLVKDVHVRVSAEFSFAGNKIKRDVEYRKYLVDLCCKVLGWSDRDGGNHVFLSALEVTIVFLLQ